MPTTEPKDSVNIRASGDWARWVLGAFVAILIAGVTHFVAFRDVQKDVVVLSASTTALAANHEAIVKRVSALESRLDAAIKDHAATATQVAELRKEVRELLEALHKMDKSVVGISGRLDAILLKLGDEKKN